jgi:hypothetical protein
VIAMPDDMTEHPRAIAVALTLHGLDSTILIDGIDVSHYVTAITVRASVHGITSVHLDLLAGVEILGEAGTVLRGLPEAPIVTVDAVTVRPGDLVVARVEGLVSEAMRRNLDAQLGQLFPNNRIAVLGAGIGLSVWRGVGPPQDRAPEDGGPSAEPGGAGSAGGA